ncbi:hypothetical protein LENED_002131 [Lentinula edodes]|uniref:Uncharacterized protein n=1 Tax=Lentinula edodes TaxID=5353 RepID=A0A1Q3E0R4_LENED|nr:hypothetical protein LENED_002131 [Lentinula edodes]
MEAVREVGRSHAASHAALIDKLSSRLATTNIEWKKDQNLISNLEREVADLKKENAKIQGNFTIRTALEIIADLYHNRLPDSMGRKGVQTVLDMIVNGHFDHQNSITYANAQNVALKSISPSGTFKRKLVNSAASKIYHTLSQHPHSAEDDPILLQEKDYTQAEAIAIFSFMSMNHNHCLTGRLILDGMDFLLRRATAAGNTCAAPCSSV